MLNKISISTCFDYSIPIYDQLKLISAVGFKYVSLGANTDHFNYLDKDIRQEFISESSKLHLKVDTIHACRIDNLNNADKLIETIKSAHEFNSAIIVVHASEFCVNEKDIQCRIETAYEVCSQIYETAKEHHIQIAIENVFPGNGDKIVVELLKKLDKDTFGFCYDSSHDQIDGPRSFMLLEELKNRIFAVHMSDRQKEFVDHMVPGEGFINFTKIMESLDSVNYKKPLLFEVMIANSQFKTAKSFLDEVYKAGIRLYKIGSRSNKKG